MRSTSYTWTYILTFIEGFSSVDAAGLVNLAVASRTERRVRPGGVSRQPTPQEREVEC